MTDTETTVGRVTTGQAWQDCACCGAVRIPADWTRPGVVTAAGRGWIV